MQKLPKFTITIMLKIIKKNKNIIAGYAAKDDLHEEYIDFMIKA